MSRANLDRIEQLVDRHHALRLQREQLLADHDRYRTLGASASLEFDYAEHGAPSFLADSEPTGPDEDRLARRERELLSSQLERLRAENQALVVDQSNRVNLVAELEQRIPQLAAEEHSASTQQAAVERETDADPANVSSDDLVTARTEIDRLTEQLARCHDELDTVIREGGIFKSELAALRDRYQRLCDEHRSTESLCADLAAENQQLLSAQERLMAESKQRSDVGNSYSQELLDRLRAMQNILEHSAQMSADLISALGNPHVSQELEEVRAKSANVRYGSAGSEYLYNHMAELVLMSGVMRSATLSGGGRNTDPLVTGRYYA